MPSYTAAAAAAHSEFPFIIAESVSRRELSMISLVPEPESSHWCWRRTLIKIPPFAASEMLFWRCTRPDGDQSGEAHSSIRANPEDEASYLFSTRSLPLTFPLCDGLFWCRFNDIFCNQQPPFHFWCSKSRVRVGEENKISGYLTKYRYSRFFSTSRKNN